MHSRPQRVAVAVCVALYSTTLASSHLLFKHRNHKNRSQIFAHHTRHGFIHSNISHQLTPCQRILAHNTDNELIITDFTQQVVLNEILSLFVMAQTHCNLVNLYRRKQSRKCHKFLMKSLGHLNTSFYYIITSGTVYQWCIFFSVANSSLSV